MAACVVCGQPLPPTSRRDRITCSARCRKRRSRHALALRPASTLTVAEAMERLALLDPERWGPPPTIGDEDPDGDLAAGGQLARDPLDGLPEDDPVRALLADDHGVLEWLLADDPAPETRPQAGTI